MHSAHAVPHLPHHGPPPACRALIIAGLTKSAHLGREMPALGPITNPTTTAPILQQQRRSTGYPTYPLLRASDRRVGVSDDLRGLPPDARPRRRAPARGGTGAGTHPQPRRVPAPERLFDGNRRAGRSLIRCSGWRGGCARYRRQESSRVEQRCGISKLDSHAETRTLAAGLHPRSW